MSVVVTPLSSASAVPTQQRVIGWALLVCWFGLVISTLVVGHRATTFAQLEADVAAGEATDVRVSEGLGPDSVGFSGVRVQWRRGVLGYSTEVLEVQPRREAAVGMTSNDDVTEVLVDESVPDRLAEVDPNLAVETTDWENQDPAWDGWTRPQWLGVALVGVLIATVALLAYGSAPRHATRWGWFWLTVVAAPLGAVAFLLMSGAISPSNGLSSSRRLSGGWALLLALLIEGAMAAVVAAVT